jgi:hypothetical protein
MDLGLGQSADRDEANDVVAEDSGIDFETRCYRGELATLILRVDQPF